MNSPSDEGIYLNAAPTCFTRLAELTSLPIEPVPDKCSLPTKQSEKNLAPNKCSFNFGKKKKTLGHREAIRRKCPGMFSDGITLLHDNTHIARKTQELLQTFKWEVWSHLHTAQNWHLIWVPNTSGTSFSSNSDVKTAADNWLNGEGRDFYQVGLNKLAFK
ncbi:hypothetical protein AVEN_248967-1 [Araneus ventricosus]|uniref:Uncharacterized protein n=1 Tax=Araneus ventricosus TaxID=182803 RepID=A0A4Y2J521_ARAVE|nr:hypothetical protein AVEN_248967-1 [Araneus ventricosus]